MITLEPFKKREEKRINHEEMVKQQLETFYHSHIEPCEELCELYSDIEFKSYPAYTAIKLSYHGPGYGRTNHWIYLTFHKDYYFLSANRGDQGNKEQISKRAFKLSYRNHSTFLHNFMFKYCLKEIILKRMDERSTFRRLLYHAFSK